MSRSVRTPARRPSGSATNTESPVPVRRIAARQSARLVPGWTVTGSRRLTTWRRSSARDGDARSDGAFGEFTHAASVVVPSGRGRDGGPAAASLRRWIAAAPSGSPSSSFPPAASAPAGSSPSRSTRQGVDWHVLSAWRFGFGAPLAWVWLLASAGPTARPPAARSRTALVALALGVLYTGNSGTYYAGLETVPASLAALIVYIYPAIVAVLVAAVGRRLEGRRPWFALALALVGVVLAVGGIPDGTRRRSAALAPDRASPIIYSVWIVLSARLAGERSESLGRDAGDGADAAAATALMMTATAGDVLARCGS